MTDTTDENLVGKINTDVTPEDAVQYTEAAADVPIEPTTCYGIADERGMPVLLNNHGLDK